MTQQEQTNNLHRLVCPTKKPDYSEKVTAQYYWSGLQKAIIHISLGSCAFPGAGKSTQRTHLYRSVEVCSEFVSGHWYVSQDLEALVVITWLPVSWAQVTHRKFLKWNIITMLEEGGITTEQPLESQTLVPATVGPTDCTPKAKSGNEVLGIVWTCLIEGSVWAPWRYGTENTT